MARYTFVDINDPSTIKMIDPQTFEPLIRSKLFSYRFPSGLTINQDVREQLDQNLKGRWELGTDNNGKTYWIEFVEDKHLDLFLIRWS